MNARNAYRLTTDDEARITSALERVWADYRPTPRKTANVVQTLERIVAHSLGCSVYDLRDSERDWIVARIRDLK